MYCDCNSYTFIQEKLASQEHQMKLKGKKKDRFAFCLPLPIPPLRNIYFNIMYNTHPEKALSEAHKSLNDIRSEMLAWQAQYSDIRKELKEVKGTSDTLRVKQARVAKCVVGTYLGGSAFWCMGLGLPLSRQWYGYLRFGIGSKEISLLNFHVQL